MAKSAAKNKELTLAEKMKVIEALSGPKISQRLLGRRFGASQPQICRIIKNKEQLVSEWRSHINPGRKRRRDGKAPPVEEALLRWFVHARAAGETVNGTAMKQAAWSLATALGREGFWPSNGWLSRFKLRHNIVFGGSRGRGRDGRGHSPAALGGYPPGDVYWCAEAAVRPGGAGETLAALLCACADGGDKRRLLVAGRGPEPWGPEGRALPAVYLSGGEGLSAERFAAWLADFDREMGRQGRRVAVIAEGAGGGSSPGRPLSLGNVRLLPPPLPGPSPARGIARHFERLCRAGGSSAAGSVAGQLTALDALRLMACAWRDVQPGTIAGCLLGDRLDGGAEEPPAGVPQELFDRSGQTDGGPARGDESAGPEPQCPTAAQALECLAGLRRFLECRGASVGAYRKVRSLEDEVVQLAARRPGDTAAERPRNSDTRSDPEWLCAESDQLLQFAFPDHQVSALREMDQLRREEIFCDVTIVAEGLRFPAHRAVLATCSPFLRDRFRADPSPEVPVPPIAAGPEVLSRLLSSCYTGALDFPFKEVVSYLTVASCLQMGHVVERCRQSFSPSAASGPVPGVCRSTPVRPAAAGEGLGICIAKVESLAVRTGEEEEESGGCGWQPVKEDSADPRCRVCGHGWSPWEIHGKSRLAAGEPRLALTAVNVRPPHTPSPAGGLVRTARSNKAWSDSPPDFH